MKTGRDDLDAMIRVASIPSDEPTFLLRAQDAQAAQAVRRGADLQLAAGAPEAVVEQALRQADAMEAWPVKKPLNADHLSDNAAKRLAYAFQLAREGREPTDKPVAFPPRSYTNPRTGEVVRVEGGIGPGWGYNVGKAYLERDTPSPMGPPAEHDGEAMDAGAGRPAFELREVSADLVLPIGVSAEEAQAAFLGGFGIGPDKSRIVADKIGENLVVGPGLFKDSVGKPVRLSAGILRALPLVGLTLREPSEIRRAWRFGPGGKSLLCRRYMARYQAGHKLVWIVVDWANGGWWPGVNLGAGAIRFGRMRDAGELVYGGG